MKNHLFNVKTNKLSFSTTKIIFSIFFVLITLNMYAVPSIGTTQLLYKDSLALDTILNKTGTKVWIENANDTITIWNDCPSKKIATKKPLVKKEKKVNHREVDFIGIISKVDTSKVEVPKKENNMSFIIPFIKSN